MPWKGGMNVVDRAIGYERGTVWQGSRRRGRHEYYCNTKLLIWHISKKKTQNNTPPKISPAAGWAGASHLTRSFSDLTRSKNCRQA